MNKDELFIRESFRLAKKGIGLVSPNPLVGCVIVKNNEVIAKGFHRFFGGDHAEVDAIKNSTQNIEDSTLYCNLEPCCHLNKKTPPCAQLLIEKKVKKVVISNLDPNPNVSGQGIKLLRETGIEVVTGVLEEEGLLLNEVFFKWIQCKRPFVHLKWAQTLDGKMACLSGDSKWISSEAARREVHELRLKYDAILVGKKTLNVDNPRLNVRMGVDNKGKYPFRIVLGSILDMNLDSKIFTDQYRDRTIVLTTDRREIDGVKTIQINSGESFLEDSLVALGELGISSLLVEGGPQTFSGFFEKRLWDRCSAYIVPKLLGPGTSLYQSKAKNLISESIKFNNPSYRVLDDQIVMEALS